MFTFIKMVLIVEATLFLARTISVVAGLTTLGGSHTDWLVLTSDDR